MKKKANNYPTRRNKDKTSEKEGQFVVCYHTIHQSETKYSFRTFIRYILLCILLLGCVFPRWSSEGKAFANRYKQSLQSCPQHIISLIILRVVDQQTNHSLNNCSNNTLQLFFPSHLQCPQMNIHTMRTSSFINFKFHKWQRNFQFFQCLLKEEREFMHLHPFTNAGNLQFYPMAYFCVQLRAVASYFALSVLYMCAISGTSGSSGLGSVNREHMDNSTWTQIYWMTITTYISKQIGCSSNCYLVMELASVLLSD